jgi:diguanylate cyclase (GGDEF)-like protein
MVSPKLSVRMRLLALCLGLLLISGSSSLLLGWLILGNQAEQQAQQEQYRRFEIIQGAGQAINLFRHHASSVNSALLQNDARAEAVARQARDAAWRNAEAQLDRLGGFDPASAQRIRAALDQVPGYSQQVMEQMRAGKPGDPQVLGELQRQLNLIESTLDSASQRERALAESIQLEAARRAAWAIRVATAMIVGAGLVGIVLVLLVVRSIIGPLRVTIHAIRQVNAGEQRIDLPPLGGDEFGEMAQALRQFSEGAEKLRRLAYQDPLTSLPNRARLDEVLQAALDAGGPRPVLLYLDLDNFRSINDRFGHKAGDTYLCEAAQRLQRHLPRSAELFRYAGDKFIALLRGLGDSGLRQLADAVLRGVAEPYLLEDQLLHMSVSIGIALAPGDGDTAEHLISSAEAAGHAAKRSGRNNARFAGGHYTGRLRRESALVEEIRRGLALGEFELYYQPIVDVGLQRAGGAEALVRWRHPRRGLLLPGEFIQVAENEGLIGLIGDHCLRQAHAQLVRWRAAGMELRVAVNLSARQVQDERILDTLAGLRAADTAAAAQMDLELTESLLFDSSDSTRRVLEEIKRCGYRLGMDDFGTGYSSLSYLRRLPVDKVKVDRQFVTDIATSRQSQAIVSAVLALARTLDLEVVAEGVETPQQMRLLQEQGCLLQQGFLFSQALPAGEFARWVTEYRGDAHLPP